MTENRIIKVLIVEDDEFITMVYLDQLKDVTNITFEIDTHTTLSEGIEAVRQKNYDVLLLDLNLPDSPYSQTIEKIPLLSNKLPVIIMTSTNDEVLALKTMNMGGQDYLVKTKLERNLFIRSVLYAIERNQLRTQLQAAKDKSDALLITVSKQKEEVEKQKNIVQHQNEEILSSIEYAKRIQATILPPIKVVKKYLADSFILYLPKDIVAGDFYWMEESTINDNVILLAACDSTGHGVPGAMVSVVCSNALNRAVKEFNIEQPAALLDKVNELVVSAFSRDVNEDVQDGMDASICAINFSEGILHWSGANNPLWIISKNELKEYKADKQPIGKYENSQSFTNHEIKVNKGDTIYLFTDGYADQFGGEKNKKLTKAQLKETLLSIQHLNMNEQRNFLNEFHNNYKGNNEQIDDILIIGVRV